MFLKIIKFVARIYLHLLPLCFHLCLDWSKSWQSVPKISFGLTIKIYKTELGTFRFPVVFYSENAIFCIFYYVIDLRQVILIDFAEK